MNKLEIYFCSIAITKFGGRYACKHMDILGKYCFPENFCDKCKAVDVVSAVRTPYSQIRPIALPSEQILERKDKN